MGNQDNPNTTDQKAAADLSAADKAKADPAKPDKARPAAKTPAWQLPGYAGPLDIRQAQWRQRNIKPVDEVRRK